MLVARSTRAGFNGLQARRRSRTAIDSARREYVDREAKSVPLSRSGGSAREGL